MTQIAAKIEDAVRAVRQRSPLNPPLGVILGSGLGALLRDLERAVRMSLTEIPHMPVGQVEGQGSDLVLGLSHGVPIAALTGRPHLYEGVSPQDLAFPVRVLAKLGVRILIVTNAAGSVNVNYRPGELVVLEDHINLTGTNPLTGPHEPALGQRFPDMSETYDPRLREIAEKACWKAGVTVRKGIYLAFTGPSYETPAEIRMARTLGADVVGMSTVPEVIAARQAGLRVLGLSCITNMAAGVLKKPLAHAEVLATTAKVRSALTDVLATIIQAAAQEARSAPAKD
jgi:purine-nucleoside phosphorylase